MHQGLPWAFLQLGIVTTVSWSTVATWFSAHEEAVQAHCSAEDSREECSVGGPQSASESLRSSLKDTVDGPGASRTKETIDTGSLRRRYGSNATAENASGTDGVAQTPPAEYYDDIFHRIISIVSELLGRAAVATRKYIWTALYWFGH